MCRNAETSSEADVDKHVYDYQCPQCHKVIPSTSADLGAKLADHRPGCDAAVHRYLLAEARWWAEQRRWTWDTGIEAPWTGRFPWEVDG